MSMKKKQKQLTIEEYIKTYCEEKRIRGRFAVYISPETHANLKKIAGLFKSRCHSTCSSLADAIISSHIETHRELLNQAIQEDKANFLKELEEVKQSRSKMPNASNDEE